jgi:hypothetical protein
VAGDFFALLVNSQPRMFKGLLYPQSSGAECIEYSLLAYGGLLVACSWSTIREQY